MNVLGVIQARISSERLPRKVLKKISGKPMLVHVIERLKRSKMVYQILLATSNEPEDAILKDIADKCNIHFFTGPLSNVLERFLQVGRSYNAKNIVRICGDNPLVDYEYLDIMIYQHLRERADYTYNDSDIPLGTAGEVVSLDALEKIDHLTTERCYREHVTTYFLEFKERFKVWPVAPPLYLRGKNFRLTVDTEEDLKLIRKIYKSFYKENKIIDLKKVIDFLEKDTNLLSINMNIKQRDWKKTA